MPRTARIVIPRVARRVTQRGNNRQDVFFVDTDREMFLVYLQEAATRFSLRIEGYCLMTTQVHLVVTPAREDSRAGAHGGGDDVSGLPDLVSWRREMDPAKWRGILRQYEEERRVPSLRLATSRGRPLGSDGFIAKRETLLDRRLRALPGGRPRKTKATRDKAQEGDRQ